MKNTASPETVTMNLSLTLGNKIIDKISEANEGYTYASNSVATSSNVTLIWSDEYTKGRSERETDYIHLRGPEDRGSAIVDMVGNMRLLMVEDTIETA